MRFEEAIDIWERCGIEVLWATIEMRERGIAGFLELPPTQREMDWSPPVPTKVEMDRYFERSAS